MKNHASHGIGGPADEFATDPSGLPPATGPDLLELADGDTLDLRAAGPS